MAVSQFSLLIQAAGTALLLFLFLLLYRKIRRRAFLDWIASWALFLAGLLLLLFAGVAAPGRPIVILLNAAFAAHAVFLARGARHFRREDASGGALEALWAVPVLVLAGWGAVSPAPPGHFPPVTLFLATVYVASAVFFAIGPGSPAGRFLLSTSFLLWGVAQAIIASAEVRFRHAPSFPAALQYAGFAILLLEMMIAVGIILVLFEASQAHLASEMRQLRRSDELLKELSLRDPLTGLYNRHHFNDVIRRELASLRRNGACLSILLADVDRFKEINDRLGHAAGDDVLKFVANYLTSCVRESDYVFRWGGDEFLILLPRTEEADAAQKAEELGRSMPRIPGPREVRASLSVGWATHRSGAEFPAALAEADARMYERKVSQKTAPGEPEPGPPNPA